MADDLTGATPRSPGEAGSGSGRGVAGRRPAADFVNGGTADALPAGPELMMGVEAAWQPGLSGASEDELIGLMRAARRLASRAAALEWSSVAELAGRRRAAGRVRGEPEPGELVDAEIAAALTLTRNAAAHLQDVALGTARLPGVMKSLAAGRIDAPKASVIAAETAGLGDVAAGAVAAGVIRDAPGQTTGQLRAACRRMVLVVDPSAAARRKEAALRQARVELWHEPDGTAALAGRDLPAAQALAADRHLAAAARWLKSQGIQATVGQLRARAFLALLTGQPLQSLLAKAQASGPGPARSAGNSGPHPAPGPGLAPDAGPASGAGPSAGHGSPPGGAGADRAGLGEGAAEDENLASPGPVAPGPASPGPGWPDDEGAAGGGGSVLTGSVNLTLPLLTWLGWSQSPAQVSGFGPLDAADSRALAAMLAANPATRWCLTLVGPDGQAVAHACARRGPGPLPGTRGPSPGGSGPSPGGPGPPLPGSVTGWLAGLRPEPLGSTPCDHAPASPGYHPRRRLQHLVRIRNPTCTHPGCRMPASRCDLDHSRAYHRGGLTCLCNLGPTSYL